MAQASSSLAKVVRAALLVSLAAASVAACAGGGGVVAACAAAADPAAASSATSAACPPLPPPVAPASSFETPEYFGSLSSAATAPALARSTPPPPIRWARPGRDHRRRHRHQCRHLDQRADRPDRGTLDVNAAGRAATDIDTDGHGTMVSSVIVANKNNVGMHGVAYEAKVLAIRADTRGLLPDAGVTTKALLVQRHHADRCDQLRRRQGAKIINMSLGGDDGSQISPQLRAAMISAVNQGVLFTIAAGNEGAAPTGTAAAKGLTRPSRRSSPATRPCSAASSPSGAIDNATGRCRPSRTAPGRRRTSTCWRRACGS